LKLDGFLPKYKPMVPERKYMIHPYYIILSLAIAGITALFLGVTAAYMYNRIQQGVAPVQLPALFYFNTLIIAASSITLVMAMKMYKDDNTQKFRLFLWATLVLSVLFFIMQLVAWKQLSANNIGLTSSTMASYMYFISGLHLVHLAGGIPFLIHFIYLSHVKMRDPVTVLIFFADVDRKRVLQMLNIYWHFLDGLWIYLMLFFLLNYLI
jgi:cytochrome c oxidase subunit 3